MKDDMTVTFHEIFDPKQWDLLVSSLGGNSFHSSAWAFYNMSINRSHKPNYITYSRNNSDINGIALGVEESSSYKILNVFSKSIRLDAYPIVIYNDIEDIIYFIQELENKAKGLGFIKIEINSFSSFDDLSILENFGYEKTHRFEFIINLENSEDIILGKMDSTRRRNINRAKKSNVKIMERSDKNGLKEFRRLQEESGKRIIDRGGPDIIYKSDESLIDPIEALIENNIGRIFCAEWENQIHSAVLFTYFNGKVYHVMSGHSTTGMQIQSGSLLFWECIKYFKGIGAKYFNLGGCSYEALNEDSSEHGVFLYKSKYGGDRISCTSWSKIFNTLKHDIYIKAKNLIPRK